MQYLVKEDGQVYSERSGKILKRFELNGKWAVKAWGTNCYIHRMLWEQEFGKIPKDLVVVFKDGNPDNLTIGNLQSVNKYSLFDSIQDEFPHCYIDHLSGWKRYTCKYKGNFLCSSKKSEWSWFDEETKEVKFLTLEDFYNKKAINALAEVVENIVVPLEGYEDLYEVHTNSKHEYTRTNRPGVLRNKKTGRWISFEPSRKSPYVKIQDYNGNYVKINLLVKVWNSLYPTDKAKKVDFRALNEAYFFDLKKIK